MERKSTTLIRVRFFKAPHDDGKTVFYFGSLSAIYDSYTPEEIGCKLSTLWKAHIIPGHIYVNRKCILSKEFLQHKKQKKS